MPVPCKLVMDKFRLFMNWAARMYAKEHAERTHETDLKADHIIGSLYLGT
jgi:hypothetical protein